MRCCVPNCENNERVKKSSCNRITFHAFPKDPDQRTVWINYLDIADWTPSSRAVICSDHFKEDDFYHTKQGIRRLKTKAVPVVDDECFAPVESMLCKICLNLDAKMYSLKDFKLDKIYENITGIMPQVDVSGRLPQQVCWECAARLASAAAFRDKALLTDTLLQHLLKNETCIKISDILKLQEKHKTLKSPLAVQKLVSYNFEPNDVIKTEIVDVQPQNSELQITVNDVIAETVAIDIKEDIEERAKEFANSDRDTVKTEVDLTPIAEIDVPIEGTHDFVFENVQLSDNDTISEDAEKFDDENSESDNKTLFIPNTNVLNDNEDRNIVNDAIVSAIDDEVMCVSEPVVTLENLKMHEVKTKKESARRMKRGKNQTEWKGKKKPPYVKPVKPLDENVITITPLSRERLQQEILMRKDSERYAQAPYKCTVCYTGFSSQDKQARHALKHSEKSGPIKCEICKIRVKLGRDLRAHVKRTHTTEFSCKLCPFVTRIRNVAMGHVKFHAGAKYTCQQCLQEFEKQTTFLNHQRLKHMSDCVCDLCGYTFVSKNGVTAHKKIKHKFDDLNAQRTGPYCKVCDVKFLTQKAYDKHLRLSSKHIKSEDDPNRLSNDPSIKSRRIGVCNVKAVRRPVLYRRDVYAAKQSSGPVTCEQCGLVLENVGSYTHHFRNAHPGYNRTQFTSKSIPYMCEHCGKMFANTTTLAGHMWIHTGEKRFQCDHCSKTFSTKSNIALHMKQHEALRPKFECPICGKQFLFAHNRTRHMFLHTGIKPFKCDVCEKRFPSCSELRAHVDHVHLNKPRPKRRRAKKRDVTNIEY